MFKASAILSLTQAIPDFAANNKLTPGADTTGTQDQNCHGTIRSGLIYASKEYFSLHATLSAKITALNTDGGVRCKDAISTGVGLCNLAYTDPTTLKANQYASTSFSDKQLAIAACPQDQEECTGAKEVILENKASAVQDRTIKFSSSTSSCSYILQAKCDSPGVHLPNELASADVEIQKSRWSVFEYDPAMTTVSMMDAAEAAKFTSSAKIAIDKIQLFPKIDAVFIKNDGYADWQG